MGKQFFYYMAVFFAFFIHPAITAGNTTPASVLEEKKTGPLSLDYDKCVEIALHNNRLRTISSLAVETAELQHKQSLSAYYPSFMMSASMTRFDEGPDYNFSAPGFPDTKVALMDKDLRSASLECIYPLYTGGQRSAVSHQAEIGVAMSREDKRRTDLQILHDVKRLYYGTVLARKLYTIGKDILSHFDAVLTVTEKFFTSKSLKANKCDYLRIKTIAEGFRAYLATLEGNAEMAVTGLLNTLGLPNDTSIGITEDDIPYTPIKIDMASLLSKAYAFNPDWIKTGEVLNALELGIKEKKSGHLPKLFFVGKLFKMDAPRVGLMTDTNKDGYSIGLQVQLPVFNGFLTENQIREARVKLKSASESQILLKEGIALQVRHAFIRLSRHKKEIEAGKTAASSAEENRKLSIRAYDDNIIELNKVTEALILETVIKIQYLTALYNNMVATADLDFVIGREVNRIIGDRS